MATSPEQSSGLPEILAPAGSMEALRAACAAGADAVYFGAGEFNARRSAENFAAEEIAGAAAFCHTRGVKVYFTLNTVVFGREVEPALRLAETACRAGVDALIVQDAGLAALLRSCAPGLALHASTQMSVHSLEGVRELAEMGFSRAVLARELSKEELAFIAARSPIELEIFVHGAHCMSVSGQCYMSAFFGGRSGNRGQCAQPCRLPFSAGGERYALSLKDLALASRFAELAALGAPGRLSLKIEGRRKRPEYVFAVTELYARAARGGRIEPGEMEELARVFSRSGFTQGYFDARRGREMFGRRTEEDKAASAAAEKKLRARFENAEPPRVPVSFALTLAPGETRLSARDSDGNRAELSGRAPEQALHRALSADSARAQLAKTGGTPFFLKDAEISVAPGLTLPAAELNRLRREALERLAALRARPSSPDFRFPEPFAFPVRKARDFSTDSGRAVEKWRLRFLSTAQIPSELPGGEGRAELLFLPLDNLERALSGGFAPPAWLAGARLGAELPRVFYGDEEALLLRLSALRERGVADALCGGLSALRLARRAGLAPHGDFGLNVTNPFAAQELLRRGAASLLASIEAPAPSIREIVSAAPCGLLVYGFLPLQLLRVCCGGCAAAGRGEALAKGPSPLSANMGCFITDAHGVRFPLVCSAKRYSELLNSRPLWLADAKGPVEKAAPDFLQFYFSVESAAQAREALLGWISGAPCPGPFTRGLYAHGAAAGGARAQNADSI